MKLLIGGSPCTHWSIAQTKHRETEPSGLGWELFLNYLIAREKYRPDYFLYENNKSMSPAIRAQITRELGVEPILINSALVSAQSRQRLYWTNIPGVEQPEDRGILVRDILESGVCWKDKAYTLKASAGHQGGPSNIIRSIETNGHFSANGVAEPVNITAGGKAHHVYSVTDGFIEIKGKKYPIRLPDGLYIIRKLTVNECKRLQTVPEWYHFSVSQTQAYKMLGNGWTVDVISHILSYCPGLTETPTEVFSMYDGMSCGRLALLNLGVNITNYYATEIDKYAIATTQENFPDAIQLGDAFQVREDDWTLQKGGVINE